MFEWLENEIREIKTAKFHIVDGPADIALKNAVEKCEVPIPKSYREFVIRFGNAKLYRELNYYKVGVLASLRDEVSKGGESYYRFGHYDSNSAYFKESELQSGEETPIYEGGEDQICQVADGFETWLRKRCTAAKRKYTKAAWAKIIDGPIPLTSEEIKIIEARRKFTWRVLDVTPEQDFLIEVHNGSEAVLPFLSIGVRWKVSGSNGGIKIPVSNIPPGKKAVVRCDAYKEMVDPSKIELYSLPDPGPEDRDRYWEFRPLVSPS